MKKINVQRAVPFVIICLLWTACQQKGSDFLGDAMININYDSTDVKISDLMEDVKLIKLASADSVVVGEVSKLKFFEGKFYILDRKALKGIFVFNKDGSFVRKFSVAGKGPGEALDIVDFDIQDNKIYLLDLAAKKQLIYQLNGEFINEIKLPNRYLQFEFLEDNTILYLKEQGNKTDKAEGKIVLTDIEGKTTQEFLFRQNVDGNLRLPMVFSKYKNTVLYWEIFNDTIYRYQDAGFKTAYEVNFGDKKIPKKVMDLPLMERLTELNNSPALYAGIIDNCLECDKYLLFNFKTNGETYSAVYDKEKKTCTTVKNFEVEEFNIKVNAIQYKLDQSSFASVIYPSQMRWLNGDGKLKNTINEFDNPLILLMTLKDKK